MNEKTKIEERLLNGLKAGVSRHWRYTKDLLKVKPEYLLTIAVADELTEGFDNFHGMDIAIKLEEHTKFVLFDLLTEAVGLNAWFSAKRPKISRKGKVDIFAVTQTSRFIIELKGFNPSATELKKEFVRLEEFLGINGGNNKLAKCHVLFPTETDRSEWVKKCASETISQSIIDYKFDYFRVETGENPDDGMPCYYVNCVTLSYRH